MKKNIYTVKGFTLIEVIASLVLFVIIATAAGFGFIEITKQYLFSKNVNESMLETQFAIEKISKLLTSIDSGSTVSFGTSGIDIIYDPVNEEINQITNVVNTDKLIGNVVTFNIKYYDNFNDYKIDTYTNDFDYNGPNTTKIVNLGYSVKINDSVDKSFDTVACIE